MKQYMNRILALFLILSMVVATGSNGFPMWGDTITVEAAEDEDTYTYLSFHDYATLNGDEFSSPVENSKNVQIATRYVDNLNHVVFSGELTFHTTGTKDTAVVRVGGNLQDTGDYSWYGISLYMPNETELYSYNYYTGEYDKLGDVTLGQSVKISLQFDKIAEGQWTVAYTLNDDYIKTKTYSQNQDFGRYIVLISGEGQIEFASTDVVNATEQLEAEFHSLDGGAYFVSGDCLITDKNGEVVEVDGASQSLNTPGDYSFLKRLGSFQREQMISLYKTGDVDLNGSAGEEADLTALYAMFPNIIVAFEPDNAAEYAADLDNDGKVGIKDIELMKAIRSENTTLTEVLKKYHGTSVGFDYLDGNDVMPLVGYFGPYNYGGYDLITEDVHKLLSDAGINIINYSRNSIGSGTRDEIALNAIALAEKYNMGYLVNDDNMNPEHDSDVDKLVDYAEVSEENRPTMAQAAKWYGKYSFYQNVLGVCVIDEVFPDSFLWSLTENSDYCIPKQLKYYDWTCSTLNQYTNTMGFVNMINPSQDWYYETMGLTTYSDFCNTLKNQADVKLLSHTAYPYSSEGTESKLITYFNGLKLLSQASEKLNVPFWGYVGAGGDFRDSKSAELTKDDYLPTEAETYWNVNTVLAFGAKGIEWFPLVQPYYFAYEDKDEDGVIEDGDYDYDRNGLVGADKTTTPFYEYAKNIHTHIEVIDEVLMKSTHTGIMASGTKTLNTLESSEVTIADSVGSLTSVSGDNDTEYGAFVGCFDYRDTEAFYVVNYDTEQQRTITLKFDGEHTYRYVKNGEENFFTGSILTLEVGAGEGVLVVIEEQCSDHLVHIPANGKARIKEYYICSECDAIYGDTNAEEEIIDIDSLIVSVEKAECVVGYNANEFSTYRKGTEFTSPEAPVGYVFAGWYQDKECENSVANGILNVEGTVYAKFVQKEVLGTNLQFSKDLTSASETTNLRLVTTVNSDDYIKVGFKVTSGSNSRTYEDATAYKKILGATENMTFEYVPKDISELSIAFVTVVLGNIRVKGTNLDRAFVLQAYWETADGTTVYGEERTITINEVIQKLDEEQDSEFGPWI